MGGDHFFSSWTPAPQHPQCCFQPNGMASNPQQSPASLAKIEPLRTVEGDTDNFCRGFVLPQLLISPVGHPHFLIMHVAIGRCWLMVCSTRKKDHAVPVIASFIVYQCWEFLYTRKNWEWLHLSDSIDPEKEYRDLIEEIQDTWNSGVH